MINPMKKLLCAGRVTDKQKIIEILKKAEIVHLEPVDPSSVNVPASVSQSLSDCSRVISILDQIDEDTSNKLATPGTPVRLVEETLAHSKLIPELKVRMSAVLRELEDTSKWGSLGLKDLEYLKENGLNVVFFRGSSRNPAFSSVEAETVCAVGDDDEDDELFAAASRKEIVVPEAFRILECPKRSIEEINDELTSLNRDIVENERALVCISMRIADIKAYQLKLLNKVSSAKAETGAYSEPDIFVLSGWCPADMAEKLAETFETEKISVGLDFADPEDEDMPPTQLKESCWVKSIEPLFDFMGILPTYRMPDSSAPFLSMMAVFSAFLVADGGYGILALIILLLAYKPLIKRGADAPTLNLGITLSGAITIYGFLTNTWFGETFYMFSSYRFDPNGADGMLLMQGLCFLIGVCHLTLAHVMKMVRKRISFTWLADIGWIIFLWAMYTLICMLIIKKPFLTPFEWIVPMFEVSLGMILVFTAPSINIAKMLAAGIGAILGNASNCFSDVVSYIRLWAVGLAGGKVACAFNDIAGMLPFAAAIPVYVCGHAVNIILGIIAILAHGVRLNLLEFSNHLELDWSGRKYDPFREIK